MSFHDGAPTSIKLYTASVAHGTPGNSNVLLYLFAFDKLRREKLSFTPKVNGQASPRVSVLTMTGYAGVDTQSLHGPGV